MVSHTTHPFIEYNEPIIRQKLPLIADTPASHERSAGRREMLAGVRGFTLVELLITLAVAAILLSFGVPGLTSFVQNSRVDSATDNFLSAIQRARSEAITRGDAVILCRTGNSASDDCGTSDTKDWTPGWLMYAVPGFNGEEDYGDSPDNEIIQRGGPAPEGVTVTSDDHGNSWLTLGADGTLREDGPLAYAICDNRGEEQGKLVVIPMIGRPYVTDDMSNAPGCEPT